jgi:hypothetical protein
VKFTVHAAIHIDGLVELEVIEDSNGADFEASVRADRNVRGCFTIRVDESDAERTITLSKAQMASVEHFAAETLLKKTVELYQQEGKLLGLEALAPQTPPPEGAKA